MRAWVLVFCAGCATGAPIPLPRTAVARGVADARLEGIDVHVEAVNERNWTEHPALKARLLWDEPAMVWGTTPEGHRDIVVPLVPLPCFEVTIENHGSAPLRFADADIAVEDEAGRPFPIYSEASVYMRRVVDRMAGQMLELTAQTVAFSGDWPAPWGWTNRTLPAEALAEQAEQVPLLRSSVDVAPGETWRGVVVPAMAAESPDELARILRGRVAVVMRGLRAGTRELDTQSFVFDGDERLEYVVCNDGTRAPSPAQCRRPDGYATWMPGGPCLQVGTAHQLRHSSLSYDVQFLDGRRVGNADMYDAILRTPTSKRAAQRARSLRVAGYTLLGGGLVGAALTTGAIGGAGESRLAPAGLSVLGLSAVGGALIYFAHRQELTAVREFNQYAFATGACAAPL